MRIAHWAPFAPYRCGLYEAARDCARADYLRGHEVVFVDTGVSGLVGVREEPKIGSADHRGGWLLTTRSPLEAMDADVWVCHDGVPDSWAARCQVPMVWMVHGRPLACFRPEQENRPGNPFTIIKTLSEWPRVKALVTMWSEYMPHWEMIVPAEKLYCTGDPPIDAARYKPTGDQYQIKDPGQFNVLICDSWRDDIDIYEVACAAYQAAKQTPGMKVHFWAVEEDKQKTCWQHVWHALAQIGALGEIQARMNNIDHVYRAMDLLLSPHVIGVRTIGEALACGLPVVAAMGNRYTRYQGRPNDPIDMADVIVRAIHDIQETPGQVEKEVAENAEKFSLARFGEQMEYIYQEAIHGAACTV